MPLRRGKRRWPASPKRQVKLPPQRPRRRTQVPEARAAIALERPRAHGQLAGPQTSCCKRQLAVRMARTPPEQQQAAEAPAPCQALRGSLPLAAMPLLRRAWLLPRVLHRFRGLGRPTSQGTRLWEAAETHHLPAPCSTPRRPHWRRCRRHHRRRHYHCHRCRHQRPHQRRRPHRRPIDGRASRPQRPQADPGSTATGAAAPSLPAPTATPTAFASTPTATRSRAATATSSFRREAT